MNTRPAGSKTFLAILLIAGLPLLLFLPSHDGEFAVDDYRFIVENGDNLSRLTEPWVFFADPSTNSDRGDGDIYRPLRTLSFAVDRALFELDPRGYHLHSVLLHAIVGVLFFLLLRGLLAGAFFPSLLGALLFVAHPLTTETVCWVSSRADLHGALFILLALLAARRAESRPLFLPLVALLGMACGFGKETAIMVPALYLLEHRLRTGRWFQNAWLPLLALVVGCATYLLIYLYARDRGIAGQVDFYGGSFLTHLPFGLVGLARMLRLALLPLHLNFLWETNLFRPLAGLDVVLACAGVLGSLICVVIAWRRVPAVSVGLLWFLVAVLPAANIFLPLRTVLAERFAYVPLMGVMLALAGIVAAPILRGQARAGLGLVVLLLFATGTWSRASDWQSQERLYQATLDLFPQSYGATLGLGGVLLRQAEQDLEAESAETSLRRAEKLFGQAIEEAGDDPVRRLDGLYALGRARILLGDWRGAIDALAPIDGALQQDRGLAEILQHGEEALFDLGLALTRIPRLDRATNVFERLLETYGESARVLDALGETAKARLDGRALDYYNRALQIDPDYHDARLHLAAFLYLLPGYEGEARRQVKEVLARDPDHRRAQDLLKEFTE